MIDPKHIRENIDLIQKVLKNRNMEKVVDLNVLKYINEERRGIIAKIDEHREKRNRLSKDIGGMKSRGEDAAPVMKEVQGISDSVKALEVRLDDINKKYEDLALSLPNLLDESVPVGSSEKDNVEVRSWGKKPEFDFQPKAHFDIGTDLNILDFERGVKIAGTRFYVYRGLAARLERAIINFMLDLHTTEHGYTEIFGPFIVNDDSMIGTGQYPKFKDEYYKIERDGLSLIPTAEVTLTNLYRDEILEKENLPGAIPGGSSGYINSRRSSS
jgi:seryl-tRNA synthetase